MQARGAPLSKVAATSSRWASSCLASSPKRDMFSHPMCSLRELTPVTRSYVCSFGPCHNTMWPIFVPVPHVGSLRLRGLKELKATAGKNGSELLWRHRGLTPVLDSLPCAFTHLVLSSPVMGDKLYDGTVEQLGQRQYCLFNLKYFTEDETASERSNDMLRVTHSKYWKLGLEF